VTDPRARLRELEKRLKDEPENLGLRVMVAGVLRDAGRSDEAVELYRSVAIAYRDQGRSQQAIAVCKSILEVAPDDKRCHALLETLVAKPPVEADDIEPLPPEPETPRRTGPYAVASGTTPGEPKREVTPKPIIAKEPETPRLEPPPPRLRAASPTPAAPAPVPKTPVPASTGPVAKVPSTGPVPKTPVLAPTPTPTPKTPRPGSIIAVGTTPPAKRRATEQANEVRKKADSGTAHVIRREESSPTRRTPYEETPLPKPMPHHVADPTTSNLKKLSESDLPVAEGAETRPGDEPSTRPEVSGIANAARRISASLIASADASGLLDLDEDDLSAQLDTRQMPRIESSELRKIDGPPPTIPTERIDLVFEEITPAPRDTPLQAIPAERDSEDERTRPRDMPFDTASPLDELAGSALFVSLPARQRTAVLTRFRARSVKAGVAVIRQGETGHPLVVVVRGKLNMICERIDGTILPIGSLGAGEFVGEAALLAHVPSPVQVVAATDVELRVLPAKELYEIAGAFPSMWSVLREAADRRTRELEVKLRR
jgi:Cyclic nucleotide-binding domain